MSIASWNLLGLTDAAGALSLIVKVTLVLGVAYVAAALLRSRTAAARHFVWLLALGSVLALPLLARTPRIAVETPYWPAVASAVPAARPALKAARGAFVSVNDIDVAVPARTPAAERPARAELARWIPVLWLAGLLFVLGWQALGHLGLWRLSRASSEVTDPRWQWILGHCARQVGVSRTVELRKSAAVGSPLLCGVFQPKVVLPVDAEEWAEDLRRAVALHELAHVARRDALAQRIAGLACAVFWFHPGVWLAARRMRAESERACDDRVLGLGFPAADYAAHLLDVMKSSRALRLSGAVAIGMANRSTLEGRLLALFEKRSRGVLTRRARIVAAGAFALLLFAVAGIRPVARASASGTPAAAPKSSDALALNREQEDEQEGTPYSGTFEMGPGGTLVLRLDAGAGIVVRGWDQRQVQIDGRVGGVDGRRVAVNMTREGDQVSLVVRPKIATSNHFSSSNHFEIHVPRRFDIELRSAGGDLTVEGVQGTIRGSTGGGDLRLSRVRGRAQLSTGGGEIQVSDSDLGGTVGTGGGMVRLVRVKGGLKGSSGSGPVIYTESGRAGETGDLGDVEVDDSHTTTNNFDDHQKAQREPSGSGVLHMTRAGGPIQLGSALHGASVSTGGGEIDIGRSAGMVRAGTGGGNMRFGPVQGSLVATTGAGDVHVELGGRDEARSVDITSGMGTIVLFVPSDLGLDLDLETSYTKAHGPSHIRSDVPVEIQASTGWDDHEGTPRKYVRAQASTGRGHVRVHLKTVNGDIEIRRR